VKSRNLYVKIKLKIIMYQSKSTQWEFREFPRSSGLYGGGGSGLDYPGILAAKGKHRVLRR
jgi:hypothetical protein